MNCDYCGCKIKPPRKRFCSNKHKDKYHNETNPRGMYAHLNPDDLQFSSGHNEDDDHIFSSEGLGQWLD